MSKGDVTLSIKVSCKSCNASLKLEGAADQFDSKYFFEWAADYDWNVPEYCKNGEAQCPECWKKSQEEEDG